MVLALIAATVCGGFALQWAADRRADRAFLLASYGPPREQVMASLSEPDRALIQTYPYYAAEAASCRDCHWDVYADWALSQHARANRPLDAELDSPAFVPERVHAHGSFTSAFRRVNGSMQMQTAGPDGRPHVFHPEFVLAIEPLRQMVIPFPGGRYQATEMAYDPGQGDWFNVYGDEDRQPHEWGFWTNQGMNWNTQCAYCHMTGLRKNYDPDSDTYETTWIDHGISCRQCHGDMNDHADAYARGGQPAPMILSTNQVMHTCATCHSRREEMSDQFAPGDDFHDHFRPTLPDSLGIYYADGQVRDEDYEYVSFLLSTMHHAGISCLDCHNPHSGRLRLPVDNNALCMSCHTPPGIRGATPIVPTAHSFHAPGSTGNRCVECHMPTTVYMQRDPRRDHGFTSPDPLLTRELGIPNACNRCHQEKTTDWAVYWAEAWYGERLDRPRRERTRLIAALERGDRPPLEDIVRVTQAQEIPAWRATLLGLLRFYADEPAAHDLLREALPHPDPLIRSAAVRVLAESPASASAIRPMLQDPTRLVRMDAAWGLRSGLARGGPEYGELMEYLRHVSDQPGGVVRLSELALEEGRLDDAEGWIRRLLRWEPRNAFGHHAMARVLSIRGRLRDAIAAMNRAAAYEPANPEHAFGLALLHAEAGDLPRTESLLRSVVRTDPQFHRAWYNLGLALAEQDNLDEAIRALTRAEQIAPGTADYPYARATLHLRLGDSDAARDAARLALAIDPDHPEAGRILAELPAAEDGQTP